MIPLKRSAGILLPVFSLPSPWGIGTLGEAARDFIRFLEAAGQSYWQVLPLGETSFGDSPYQPFSSYAGNPYLIDLDLLQKDGLLTAEDYQSLPWGEDPRRVDYALLYRQRRAVLRRAAERLLSAPPEDYAAFVDEDLRARYRSATAIWQEASFSGHAMQEQQRQELLSLKDEIWSRTWKRSSLLRRIRLKYIRFL